MATVECYNEDIANALTYILCRLHIKATVDSNIVSAEGITDTQLRLVCEDIHNLYRKGYKNGKQTENLRCL